MAYGTKYTAGWKSLNLEGILYIDEEDYVGASSSLKLADNELSISYPFEDWDSFVIGLTCEFTIVNDKDDFYELLPLMYATERQYKIRVEITSPSSTVMDLFEGFLNVDTLTQKMLHKQKIRFVASSYLSKLEDNYSVNVDTLQNITYISLINEILSLIGTSFNVRVNASLVPTEDALSAGQTVFNKTGVFTELFWDNNVDRKNCLKILNIILEAFECYLYWFDGYWYIEQIEDIWNESPSYVEYTAGVSYSPTDAGSVVVEDRSLIDVHDLVYANKSQTVSVIPGYKTIQVEVLEEEGALFNLVSNQFIDVDSNLPETVNGVQPYPDFRTWQKWGGLDWDWPQGPAYSSETNFSNIENCIKRGSDWRNLASVENPHRGLYTRFKVTVDRDLETVLNISFKYLNTNGYGDRRGVPLENLTFRFYWYLRDPPGSYFIYYDADTEEWKRGGGSELSRIQYVEVIGSQWDVDHNTCKIDITIPLWEISGYIGDKDLVLCIGTESIARSSNLTNVAWLEEYWQDPAFNWAAYSAWFGDVFVTTNEAVKNNILEGTINTNFLNKKEIKLLLNDVESVNYKNGVLRGSNLSEKTTTWNGTQISDLSLAERKIRNRFRFYNVSKQNITSDVINEGQLRPFVLLEDSKQSNKKFLLTGYTFYPMRDKYVTKLFEFDDDFNEIELQG